MWPIESLMGHIYTQCIAESCRTVMVCVYDHHSQRANGMSSDVVEYEVPECGMRTCQWDHIRHARRSTINHMYMRYASLP